MPTPSRNRTPPPSASVVDLLNLGLTIEQYQMAIITVVKDTLATAATNFNLSPNEDNWALLHRAMWARQGLNEILRSEHCNRILTTLAECHGIGCWADRIATAHQDGDVESLTRLKKSLPNNND